MDKTLYYIKGVPGRGEEVLRKLKNATYYSTPDYLSGDNEKCFYYVWNGRLRSAFYYGSEADMLIAFGEELKLPEEVEEPKEVLNWKDVEFTPGFKLEKNQITDNAPFEKSSSIFANEQIARSAQAAAIISQIREQGKAAYGKIVPSGEPASILYYTSTGNLITSDDWRTTGGLLRFETRQQAELFLSHNENIVKEYLKTF